MNEKKCPACGKWTSGEHERCAFCGAAIDPALIASERKKLREEKARKHKLANENRFERYLRELEESDKSHHKIGFGILKTLFNIYMAVLSFFIWLIAFLSG